MCSSRRSGTLQRDIVVMSVPLGGIVPTVRVEQPGMQLATRAELQLPDSPARAPRRARASATRQSTACTSSKCFTTMDLLEHQPFSVPFPVLRLPAGGSAPKGMARGTTMRALGHQPSAGSAARTRTGAEVARQRREQPLDLLQRLQSMLRWPPRRGQRRQQPSHVRVLRYANSFTAASAAFRGPRTHDHHAIRRTWATTPVAVRGQPSRRSRMSRVDSKRRRRLIAMGTPSGCAPHHAQSWRLAVPPRLQVRVLIDPARGGGECQPARAPRACGRAPPRDRGRGGGAAPQPGGVRTKRGSGSWKTNEISRPQRVAQGSPRRSSADRGPPKAHRARRRQQPHNDIAVTLLPQPDSPTIASLAGQSENNSTSTACARLHQLSKDPRHGRRPRQRHAAPLVIFGSRRTSRSQRGGKRESIASATATPGNSAAAPAALVGRRGASSEHGVGGLGARPKGRSASPRIASGIVTVACTSNVCAGTERV